jgi:hypothetical protein
VTCIVAVEDTGGAWMGGDTLATDAQIQVSRVEPKVFRRGAYLFGFCGSYRLGDLLRYELLLPPPPRAAVLRATVVHRHLVKTVIPLLRTCLKENGLTSYDDGVEYGGTFLLAVLGTVWEICNDFQVGRSAHGYAAIGCGDAVALGALHATQGQPARARVVRALEAAETHSQRVRSPWTILRQLA